MAIMGLGPKYRNDKCFIDLSLKFQSENIK